MCTNVHINFFQKMEDSLFLSHLFFCTIYSRGMVEFSKELVDSMAFFPDDSNSPYACFIRSVEGRKDEVMRYFLDHLEDIFVLGELLIFSGEEEVVRMERVSYFNVVYTLGRLDAYNFEYRDKAIYILPPWKEMSSLEIKVRMEKDVPAEPILPPSISSDNFR